MKKAVFTFITLFLSLSAFAQRGFSSFTPKDLPKEIVDEMKIDDATEKKINKIYIRLQEDVINTMILARQEGEVDKIEIKKETDAIRDKHLVKAKDILDTDAYATYKNFLMLERRKRQAYVLELKLKLTADQKEKYDAINASTDVLIKNIREQHQGDREAMKEAMKPIMKQQMEMLSQILTKEQMDIIKSSRNNKGRRNLK